LGAFGLGATMCVGGRGLAAGFVDFVFFRAARSVWHPLFTPTIFTPTIFRAARSVWHPELRCADGEPLRNDVCGELFRIVIFHGGVDAGAAA